ncbi:30S ribosomal protein S4 [Candidatus Woesearchaeota archaeon]|nr:30S ribosomal protein S4 [Candidatus Woesearchaeota archaeon]
MGDPKKPKKKYSTPSHPWNRNRINNEKIIIKQYGLNNKKEIWKTNSKISNFAAIAKRLIRERRSEQAKQETENFLTKLTKIGVLKPNSQLEDVLDLSITNILERRLQTIVFKKGLANTIKQARQLTTHGHIAINNKKITIPSYLLSVDEEPMVSYAENSSYNNEEHPEIIKLKKDKQIEEVKNE